jgi:putative flippase GtrA
MSNGRTKAIARQFFKFGIVGAAGFLVDSAFLYLGIYAFGLSRIAAGFFSFPFAVTATWVGNRFFTFREVEHLPPAQQLLRFAAVCAVGLIFNRGTYSFMVSHVPLAYDYPIIALLGGTAAGMFFNFLVARRLVFRVGGREQI